MCMQKYVSIYTTVADTFFRNSVCVYIYIYIYAMQVLFFQ